MRTPTPRQQATVLVFLAPFLAELVSGSTPPQAWILPPVVLVFALIYGVAALVIRELALRTGGGGATVLLLGLAFGVVNEGMAAHSLFDPAWPALGALGSYGRWAGVNWLWAEWIVPFHAVWSISFPIFLVNRWWPGSRTVRWTSDRWLFALTPVPIATAVVTSWVVGAYPLSGAEWLGLAVAVGAFGGLGLWLGPQLVRLRPLGGWVPGPRLAATVAVLWFAAGQIGTWQTPRLGPYAEVGGALLLAVDLAAVVFVTSFDPGPDGERARFAFVLGGIGFYVALSPIAEFAGGRFALVPIDVVVLLLLLRLYVRRTRSGSDRSSAAPGAPVSP